MDRVKTGIPGFDDLIEGGFPLGFNILLTGAPGTGKTIFGLQYIYNGAVNGENGVYVSLDTNREELIRQGKQFGWDIEKYEKDGAIIIVEIPLDLPELNMFSLIEEAVTKNKAQRLVFDSLINFAINVDQFKIPLNYRVNSHLATAMKNVDQEGRILYQGGSKERVTYLLVNELGKIGTTNLIITAGGQTDGQLTVDGVSEYACDGVIKISIDRIARETVRSIMIQKMRNTANTLDKWVFDISANGISIQKTNVFQGSKVSGINP